MTASIPDTHRDLFEGRVHAVLTTIMPDGAPQSSIVWVAFDGKLVLLNTTLERQKGRNMRRDPRVSLLVVDPKEASRWAQVQGQVVDITRDGAEAHADKLAQRYTGKGRFYGDIYPMEQREKETRVVVSIEPVKVTLDAIFR